MAKSDYYLRHFCLSVRMEQLDSHWTEFHEFFYLSIFRKSVQEIHLPLKYDKSNGYFIERPMYSFVHILLIHS